MAIARFGRAYLVGSDEIRASWASRASSHLLSSAMCKVPKSNKPNAMNSSLILITYTFFVHFFCRNVASPKVRQKPPKGPQSFTDTFLELGPVPSACSWGSRLLIQGSKVNPCPSCLVLLFCCLPALLALSVAVGFTPAGFATQASTPS